MDFQNYLKLIRLDNLYSLLNNFAWHSNRKLKAELDISYIKLSSFNLIFRGKL